MHHVEFDSDDGERISVGLSLSACHMAYGSAAPSAVYHIKRDAQILLQDSAYRPGNLIRSTARTPGAEVFSLIEKEKCKLLGLIRHLRGNDYL
jgi:hypothetical protein